MELVLGHRKCVVVEQFTRGKLIMTAADPSITTLEFRDAQIFTHWWTTKELLYQNLRTDLEN